MRFDLAGSNDRELAAHPRTDAGARQARRQAGDVRGDLVRRRRSAAAPMSSAQVDPGKSVTLQAQSRAIGGATSRSTAASGISTRSVSTFTAKPIPISRRSSAASTTCASSTIRHAGRPAYDFPALRDGRVIKEAHRRPACRRRALSSCSTRAARSSPTSACARRSRCCSISSGSTTTTSSISIGALRAISRARSCRRAAGRRMSGRRALLAPFADAVRADVLDGTLVAAGQRRLRARSHARSSARSICSRRRATSCAAPSCVERAERSAVHVRDHGHGRDEERLALAVLAEPEARRDHGARARRSMRSSTKAGGSPTIST